ncbi:MAG TPA: SprT family zinc-dependent metalloprotease [Povalibacter sp.]|uniref:M48 family metallopeptidase n=1 Tax=Povalibacter sp. TaxID=1962978 RepID=UPI002B6CCA2C|nr:SprT family zinc-dependent metalloprotease [Povalibacter sp.]HMN45627.1 SprT family zinc-dependent metalloprotease [Povalibacter sp.]
MARSSSSAAQLQLFEARDPAQPWHVRISRRARRLSVRVYPGGRVEVVVPPGASAATVERFVGTHRQWIDERVADLSAISGIARDTLPDAVSLPALQRRFAIDYRRTASSEVRAVVVAPDTLIVAGTLDNEQRVARTLQRWLMNLAHTELSRVLAEIASEHDFVFRRVQIRRQRTRWGSCSASGTISLNVCALFQDPAVMRYLLIHELSHTRHMNHSRRFWAQVEAIEPDYKRLDRELLQGWQRVPGWMFR